MEQNKPEKCLFPLLFQQPETVFHSLDALLLLQKTIGQGKYK